MGKCSFSPEASFTGAAVLCAFGIATINLAKSHKHLLLLACMPFLFAIQQAGEGFVWLALQGVLTSPDALKLGKDVFIFTLNEMHEELKKDEWRQI